MCVKAQTPGWPLIAVLTHFLQQQKICRVDRAAKYGTDKSSRFSVCQIIPLSDASFHLRVYRFIFIFPFDIFLRLTDKQPFPESLIQ